MAKHRVHVKQIYIFFGIFALILASSHFYMVERLNYYLQLTPMQYMQLLFTFSLLALLTLILLPLSRIVPRLLASILAWIIYPWMGIALIMFVVLVCTDCIWLVLYLLAANYLPEPYTLLLHSLGIVAISSTIVLTIIALWNGLRPVRIKPVSITIKRLPISLDGLQIVQLTDLHIGTMITGTWVRQIVTKVNALNPDLVVITGDLVDGSVQKLKQHVAPLAELRARYGVYFITGNHEYYSGVEAWCAYVKGLGICVLRNERVSIGADSGKQRLDLVGVDDWASHHFSGQGHDLSKALSGRDLDIPAILLAHQPAAIVEAASHGIDLQLSGHTHGGQLWPFTYLVYLQQPYTKGLHRFSDTETQIYVSSGTGYWGPPMRLGTVAEITHITLHCSKVINKN